MRKGIAQYNMIAPGDRIAVGVSGGKDSMAMLTGLARLRSIIGIPYEVVAVTLDMGFAGSDYSAVAAHCEALGVPYIRRETEIAKIIFDIRKESNPCALCARMRRGALHDAAKAAGCNKVALGHHKNDAVETFLMNLDIEGRIGCFSPVTYLSRKDLTLIRPLILAEESEVKSAVRAAGIPVVKALCPVDGHTARERVKEQIRARRREDPAYLDKIFGAMQRHHLDGF